MPSGAREAAARFEALFGRPPYVAASAPGRVNLIGEHTDYNGGFVLPTVIPQETRVYLAVRDDRRVLAHSRDIGEGESQGYTLGEEARTGQWIDYVQGVTYALRGVDDDLRGFEVLIESDVPLGAGLSSSAALEVSLLRALKQAFSFSYDEIEIAKLAQRGENQLAGAPVGLMDPMASSLAHEGTALFLDTRALVFEIVPLPPVFELLVLDSGITHDLTKGDYGARRAECERAASLLGVRQLRDLSLQDLPRLTELPEPLGRRARHVITEDARVLEAVRALRDGDVERLGALFRDSHASMRDNFEVSVPGVDRLVALGDADPDVFGARLTGGGFGGSVVMLAKPGAPRAAAARILAAYVEGSPVAGRLLVPPPETTVSHD